VEKIAIGHFRIPAYRMIAALLEQRAPSVASSKALTQRDQLPEAQKRPAPRPFNPISEVGHVEGNFTQRDDGEILYGERGEVIGTRPGGQHLPAPPVSRPAPVAQRQAVWNPQYRPPTPAPKTSRQIIRKPPPRVVTIRKPDMTTLR
jgi:hypothetical protein